MNITGVTLGSDIEFFIKNRETGKYITAEGIVKGTKKRPYKFNPSNKFYATSLDCVMMEGNIPPANNSEEYVEFINNLKDYMNSILPEGHVLSAVPSAVLEDDQLQTDTAREFGCSAQYCAWDESLLDAGIADPNIRAAGKHIHVGYNNPSTDTNKKIIKAMDLFLGVPSILIEPENDRQTLGYGKAGAFRNTKWGCEYRVLSSFFASNSDLIKWSYDNTLSAINFLNNDRDAELEEFGSVIQNTINNHDQNAAENLIRHFNIPIYV